MGHVVTAGVASHTPCASLRAPHNDWTDIRGLFQPNWDILAGYSPARRFACSVAADTADDRDCSKDPQNGDCAQGNE